MKAPDFELNDEEIEALTTYYLNNRLYPLPEKYLRKKSPAVALQEKGDWMLEHFNCTGCHQVIEEAPKPHIDAYYDLKTMAPPRLVGQGARVQSEWFYKYLEKPEELRPWLKIRMPTFNLDEKGRNDFIAYFATLVSPDDKDIAQVPYTTKLVKTDYDPEVLQMGEYRVVTDKCMQCHPVSMDGSLPENVKLEDLSINLMLSKTRLRFEWIKRFLKDPDKYAGKGTKMPYIYYTPDGVPKISDADMWIDYASLYLAFMEKVPEVREKKAVEDSRSDANTDWSNY
jgi:cytochrome c2